MKQARTMVIGRAVKPGCLVRGVMTAITSRQRWTNFTSS